MSTSVRPEWLRSMVERSLDRLHAECRQALKRTDRPASLARLAELHEREARWWRVVFDHCHDRLMWCAVLGAESMARDNAAFYRRLVADWDARHSDTDSALEAA